MRVHGGGEMGYGTGRRGQGQGLTLNQVKGGRTEGGEGSRWSMAMRWGKPGGRGGT